MRLDSGVGLGGFGRSIKLRTNMISFWCRFVEPTTWFIVIYLLWKYIVYVIIEWYAACSPSGARTATPPCLPDVALLLLA